MAFNKMTANVENVSALPDVVSEQSSLLKNTFDKAGKDLKAFINTHIDELGLETSASNLGATKEGEATTVQEYLDNINDNLGDKTELTVNGEKQEEVSIYAPTTSGNVNQILRGNENGEPQWVDAPEGLVVDSALNETSTNAIQNAVVANTINRIDGTINELEERVTNSATLYKYQATIPTEGWSETAPYTIDITVEGLLETDTPDITVIQDTDVTIAQAQIEAWSKVSRIVTGTNKITCTCYEEKPEREIPILIKGVR